MHTGTKVIGEIDFVWQQWTWRPKLFSMYKCPDTTCLNKDLFPYPLLNAECTKHFRWGPLWIKWFTVPLQYESKTIHFS